MKTCDAQYAVICTYSAADKKGAIVRTSETSRPHLHLVPSDHSFTTMFARRVFYKRAPGASKKSFSTGAEEPKSAVGKAVAFVSKNRQQLVNMYVSSTTLHKHIQLFTTYIIYLAHCPYLSVLESTWWSASACTTSKCRRLGNRNKWRASSSSRRTKLLRRLC